MNSRRGRSTMVLICGIAITAFVAGFGAAMATQPQWPARLSWHADELKWVPLAEFGGEEAIIHRSPDGRRVYAAFKESGRQSFKYTFDEFGYVTSGSARVTVRGGPTVTLKKGDVFVFREGMEVDLDFSADFSDLTCLLADHEVKWR